MTAAGRHTSDPAQSAARTGLDHIAGNRFEAALDPLGAALAASPEAPGLRNALGLALLGLGRCGEAIEHLLLALAADPADPAIRLRLGYGLRALGRHDEAIEHLEAALACDPALAAAHGILGVCRQALDRPQEALDSYDRAIALQPHFAEAHHNRSVLLEQLGRIPAARAAAAAAIRFAPGEARYHRNLATLHRFAPGDAPLAALEGLAKDIDGLAPADQVHLHFGLAKACEDLGRYADAFAHLSAGNRLKRQSLSYDEPRTLALFGRIAAAFTPGLVASRRQAGDPTQVPVFVLGLPRSGTTLVEQILASHPAIHGAGEVKHFARALDALQARDGIRAGVPEMIPSVSEHQLSRLGRDYAEALVAHAPAAARIVDKMPANMLHVGLIRLALPNARIIHVSRDPVATCFSLFSTLFVEGQPYSYDLRELGRYSQAHEALRQHWRAVLAPGPMLELRYEDLVEDLEGQARRLIAHCGLAWDDACLSFQTAPRLVQTASASQVRRPIYRSSVGRWRLYEAQLGPLLEELGMARTRSAA